MGTLRGRGSGPAALVGARLLLELSSSVLLLFFFLFLLAHTCSSSVPSSSTSSPSLRSASRSRASNCGSAGGGSSASTLTVPALTETAADATPGSWARDRSRVSIASRRGGVAIAPPTLPTLAGLRAGRAAAVPPQPRPLPPPKAPCASAPAALLLD
eukprot:scaffold6655_cov87-Isochrysis_galbana.AAC.2